MISLDALVLGLVGTLGSVMLAGNAYFVKRLIDKVESAAKAEIEVKAMLGKLGQDVNAIGAAFRDFKADFKTELKDLRRFEIDLGIIKAQVSTATKGKDA